LNDNQIIIRFHPRVILGLGFRCFGSFRVCAGSGFGITLCGLGDLCFLVIRPESLPPDNLDGWEGEDHGGALVQETLFPLDEFRLEMPGQDQVIVRPERP